MFLLQLTSSTGDPVTVNFERVTHFRATVLDGHEHTSIQLVDGSVVDVRQSHKEIWQLLMEAGYTRQVHAPGR